MTVRFADLCRLLLLCLAACATKSAQSRAEATPPARPMEAGAQPPAHVVRAVRIGEVVAELASSATLISLHRALGFGSAPAVERVGEFVEICYRLSGLPPAFLRVRSWDLGGPQMTLLGFLLHAPSTPPAGRACETLEVHQTAAATELGIGLGTDSAEVTRLLGVPDSVRGAVRYYMRLVSTPEGIDELSSLAVEIAGGHVRGLEGSFVRTR